MWVEWILVYKPCHSFLPTLRDAFHSTNLVMFLCCYGSINDMSLPCEPQTTNSINHNDVIIGQCALLKGHSLNHQLFIVSQWLFDLCQHVWQNLTFMPHCFCSYSSFLLFAVLQLLEFMPSYECIIYQKTHFAFLFFRQRRCKTWSKS